MKADKKEKGSEVECAADVKEVIKDEKKEEESGVACVVDAKGVGENVMEVNEEWEDIQA